MNAEFAQDFINLQSEIPTMPKDKTGYNYKYTDLDTIITILKPLAKKHNIGFMQLLETKEDVTGITTKVIHKSGETLEGFCRLPAVTLQKTNNAQNEGAAITYFKRYALAAIFGISSDEDTDCNLKQATAAEERKYAPTFNHSSSSLSAIPAENTQKKLKINTVTTADKNNLPFTPEEASTLGDLMGTVIKNKPVFTEEEKNHYKQLLKKGKAADAIAEARIAIKDRSLAIEAQ